MSVTVTVPLNNGVVAPLKAQPATFTLQLPAGVAQGAEVTWASSVGATGTVTPANDGKSALFTPVGINGSTPTVITATVYDAPGAWEPGKLYYVGNQILDQNGHIQQVSAASGQVPSR